MARFTRKGAKKDEIVFLIPEDRIPMSESANLRPLLEEPEIWEPSAAILVMAGLALLISLALAALALLGAIADVSACNIFPALALPAIWLPLVASGFAISALVRNDRHPRPKYRDIFVIALWCWLLLMPLALYAGLATFDVQVHTSACTLPRPDTSFLGPPLN
jgi:hypothetical protein